VACKVWRGVKGGVLPRQFWEQNSMGVKGAQGSMCLVNDASHVSAVAIYLTGGIERGFLSFTTEKTKALGFSKADEGKSSQSSMLFEVLVCGQRSKAVT